jgi:predicted component of type VI protein secretion system
MTFGRDVASSLIVEAEWVSRHHANIEHKRGHFVLIDRSTNGTFVALSDDEEVRVHREEFVLRRGGVLSFGQSTRVASEHLVHFEVEGVGSPDLL